MSEITRGFSRALFFLGEKMRDETATPWRTSRRFIFFVTFFSYVYNNIIYQ